MLRLIAAHPKIEYQWSTYFTKSKDDQGRPFVGCCVKLRYEREGDCSKLETLDSSETHFVAAVTTDDAATIDEFNVAIESALRMCHAPIMKRWDDCVLESWFHSAETSLLASKSFEVGFRRKVIVLRTEKGRYFLCRGALWRAESNDPSDDKCQEFLMEFFRHEEFGLPRLDSSGYFDEIPSQLRRGLIPEQIRNEVWRRDEGKCAECGG